MPLDLPRVLDLVVDSGFVMKDSKLLNEQSKIETTSKEMYLAFEEKYQRFLAIKNKKR